MKTGFIAVGLMLFVVACAPVPEPETPPSVAPTKRSPQREPLQPAPSNMPEIVYASATHSTTTNPQRAHVKW